jgi:hypothetical protein
MAGITDRKAQGIGAAAPMVFVCLFVQGHDQDNPASLPSSARPVPELDQERGQERGQVKSDSVLVVGSVVP